MKIDMHCHVKEGSIDSRVGIEEYIEILKKKGFQGMVITDHDTYNGYRYWKENIKGKKHTDFVVLKGIEYDTRDAGHILVIMPEGVKIRLLEMRGMPLALLIDLVHRNGGVLGPAHPCGEKYMSFTHARKFYQSPEIIKRFDFVEGFNSCETTESNAGAMKLAKKYGKLTTGGSDSHKSECVGRGYTILPEPVSCETELISLTAFEKLMGKKKFQEILGEYVVKPPGKLALVPDSDPREAVDLQTAEDEFAVLD